MIAYKNWKRPKDKRQESTLAMFLSHCGMGKDRLDLRMERSIKAHSKMAKDMGKESASSQLEPYTKETGKKTCPMVLEPSSLETTRFLRASLPKDRSPVRRAKVMEVLRPVAR